MAGSVFGNIFKISTWGESHGEGLGVVIDGCPAGLPLCEEDIQEQLDRRKPGQSKFTTPRKEDDGNFAFQAVVPVVYMFHKSTFYPFVGANLW